jgi:hypothetical protein
VIANQRFTRNGSKIASLAQVSPRPSVHAQGPHSSRRFAASRRLDSSSAWKGKQAILYFQARDSVLSVRKRTSNRAGATRILRKVQHMTASVAFHTKSFGPSLERCELLRRSNELLALGSRHPIIQSLWPGRVVCSNG